MVPAYVIFNSWEQDFEKIEDEEYVSAQRNSNIKLVGDLNARTSARTGNFKRIVNV